MKIVSSTLIGLAGLTAVGLMAMQTPAVGDPGSDDTIAKRDDDGVELVLVADDNDDDPTNDPTDGVTDLTDDATDGDVTNGDVTNTRDTGDNTASNVTAATRDRDVSRADNTRDQTMDGGDLTRDHTAGSTNDNSRNDTR